MYYTTVIMLSVIIHAAITNSYADNRTNVTVISVIQLNNGLEVNIPKGFLLAD